MKFISIKKENVGIERARPRDGKDSDMRQPQLVVTLAVVLVVLEVLLGALVDTKPIQ